MKRIFLTAILLAPLPLLAQPSSQVAWTAEELNFVKAGNAQKGQTLAQTCIACHGEKGISPTAANPSLAGQMPTYLFKQLRDYADGSRDNPIMSGLAKGLSKQDAADLAAWFASLPAPPAGTAAQDEKAATLVKQGSSERVLPPCEVCHATNGAGQKMDIPALAGQNAEYLSATLAAFKTGSRHNDIYGRMRSIAQTLTDEEIAALGRFYQQLER